MQNTEIVEEVKVFRFKDHREVPLDQLTNEELIHALKFSDQKLSRVCDSLDTLEAKMEANKALSIKQEKEFKLLSQTSEKLTYLHEDLRKLGIKRDLIVVNDNKNK